MLIKAVGVLIEVLLKGDREEISNLLAASAL